jgi:hypothetical protein
MTKFSPGVDASMARRLRFFSMYIIANATARVPVSDFSEMSEMYFF